MHDILFERKKEEFFLLKMIVVAFPCYKCQKRRTNFHLIRISPLILLSSSSSTFVFFFMKYTIVIDSRKTNCVFFLCLLLSVCIISFHSLSTYVVDSSTVAHTIQAMLNRLNVSHHNLYTRQCVCVCTRINCVLFDCFADGSKLYPFDSLGFHVIFPLKINKTDKSTWFCPFFEFSR